MKYFLSVIFFAVVQVTVAQQSNFDFDKAWEAVYKAELRYLPNTAESAADSIYEAAKRLNEPYHQTKALIYQAKFPLLRDNRAHAQLVERFTLGINTLEPPYRNVLQNQLAGHLNDIYNNNSWRIDKRTPMADPEGEIDTWDKEKFFSEITRLYSASLALPDSLINAPLSDFEELVDATAQTRKYRPLLIDLLAHNALKFFKENERARSKPPQAYVMEDRVLLSEPEKFVQMSINHADSGSYYLKALKLYQRLTKIHLDRKPTWPLTDLSVARINFVHENGYVPRANERYRMALAGLLYVLEADSSAVIPYLALARFEYGLGGKYRPNINERHQFKKVEAVAICDTILAKFPKSRYTQEAEELKQNIVQSILQLNLEAYVLPDKPSKLLARYSNVDQVYMQSYRIKPDQFYQFQKQATDSARRALLSGLTKAKQWKVALKNEGDYQQHSQETLFPAHGLGAYMVVAFADEATTTPLSYAMTQVTRLAMIQAYNPYKKTYKVFDRENGEPIEGASAHFLSTGNNNGKYMNRHFTTDKDGMFGFANGDWRSGVSIYLKKGDDSIRLGNQYLNKDRSFNEFDSTLYTIGAELFTDRAIYRPGQEVHFKAILFKQQRQGSVVIPNETLLVTLYDPNDNELWFDSLKTNEFGSITSRIQLPKTGITGQFYLEIEASDEDREIFDEAENSFDVTHEFRVEEYKRPKFEINFDPIEEAYRYHDSVFVHGQATALAGSQLSHAKVTYKVQRRTVVSNFDYYRDSKYRYDTEPVTHGELKTDADGRFTIPFKALIGTTDAQSDDIQLQYEISVAVTDLNGETRENTTSVLVAKNPYQVRFDPKSEYEKGPDSLRMPIFITTINNAKKALGGTLTIEKLQAPRQVKRALPWSKADYQAFSKKEHDRLFPHWPYENDEEPHEWPVAKKMLQKQIEAGTEASTKIGVSAKWPAGYYRVTFGQTTEQGDSLQASKVFLLESANPKRLSDKARFKISLDKKRYEIGDTAIVSFGSAAKDLGVHYTVFREFSVAHFNLNLRNEVKQVRIPIREGDEAGITIHYNHVAHNDFQKGVLNIEVITPKPKLVLETGTFRNKLQPGSPEEWSFTVKGKNGESASAELLASMYDASLDQFSTNNWSFDATYQPDFYTYGRIEPMGSFSTTLFRNLTSRNYYRPQTRSYENWNGFGLDVRRPAIGQKRYLYDLRFRYDVTPKIKSEKKDIPTGTIQGNVYDEVGNPVIGANVTIAGTNQGTPVDEQGNFSLKAKRGQKIIVSFLGYRSYSFLVNEDNFFTITLEPDAQVLQEVVVVGYGSQEKKEITSSVVIEVPEEEEVEEEVDGLFMKVEEAPATLQGRVAGVNVEDSLVNALGIDRSKVSLGYSPIRLRGLSSMDAAKAPLMVIDGVPQTGRAPLDPDLIASFNVLQGNEATTLYGARAVNGVIIITTKKELERQNALLATVKARTNLNETAFFLPQLKTNEAGEVSFNFTSPESLTRWKLQLLAHDKKLASALLKQTVVTQKELMLLPNAPRFLREGDQLTFSAKIASLSTDSLSGFARLEFFDAVTEEPVQSVIQSPAANPTFRLAPNGNTEVSWTLKIPEGLQAVRYRIVALAGDFSDGEESILPVLSNRMMVQESLPLWANAKTSKAFTLDKLQSNTSNTLTQHRLSLSITTNPVWEAIRSLPYLLEYPYECAEQTFARLYANSLGQHIVEQQPAIQEVFEKWKAAGQLNSKLEQNQELKDLLIEETPWLREAKSETEQQKRMAALFEADQLAEGLEASLQKLKEMQLSSGGFPWFAGSDRENRYMTQHIVTGLAHLGLLTGNTKDYISIQVKAMEYMSRAFVKDYKGMLERDNFDPKKNHISFYQIQYLYALTMLKPRIESEEWMDAVDFYRNQAYRYWPEMSLQSRAMIALYAHANGDKKQAKKIMRSLKQYATESEELGNYWKNNVSGWYNWQAPIETQALLIEAFTKVTKDEKFVNGLRQWLLNHKRVNSWSSTKATTEAIYALLFTGEDWTKPNNSVTVTVGSEQVLSPDASESGAEAGTGQVEKIWSAEEVKPELSNVVINNQGKMQVWGGLYWQYFEDLDQITPAMGPLNIEKQLFLVKQTATGEELQKIDENAAIKVGDLVRVRMVLKSDRAMEFIHLKDMRASGFEPVNVLSGYRWQEGLGYYESTRDAATNFFIEYLPEGTFVFEYDLRANNEGDFSNGITSIQNMYAPEFSSHSEGIRVVIRNDE